MGMVGKFRRRESAEMRRRCHVHQRASMDEECRLMHEEIRTRRIGKWAACARRRCWAGGDGLPLAQGTKALPRTRCVPLECGRWSVV